MAKYEIASYMMLCKINDFASEFLIPANFVKKYAEISGKVSVTLETVSGKSWNVQIKRIDGDLYMKDGWPEFAMDNGLTKLDFLTFRWLHRSSSFKVSIYGVNCCLKHPISPTSTGSGQEINTSEGVDCSVKEIKRGRKRPRTNANKKSKSSKAAIANDVVSNSSASNDSNNKLPYVEIDLKSHRQSRVTLLKELKDAMGDIRRKKYVMMEYAATRGRKRKRVELDHRYGSRTDLAKGWREFREANGMVFGKTYSLEFNPKENVIRVDRVK